MRTLKKMSLVTLAASVLLASGCASIVNDKTQKLNVITSNGAKISINVDGKSFEVPGIIEVTRSKQDKIFIAENDNCMKQTLVPKQIDTMFFGNVISGGAYGSTTDYVTEKMWKYSENVMINCK